MEVDSQEAPQTLFMLCQSLLEPLTCTSFTAPRPAASCAQHREICMVQEICLVQVTELQCCTERCSDPCKLTEQAVRKNDGACQNQAQ